MKYEDFKRGVVVRYEMPFSQPVKTRGSVIHVDDEINILGDMGDSLTISKENFNDVIDKFKIEIVEGSLDIEASKIGNLLDMFSKDDFDANDLDKFNL